MKNWKNRWVAVLLVVLVAATFVAGCGDSSTTTTTKTDTKTETKTDNKTDTTKPADQTFQKDPNTTLTLDKATYKPNENIVVKFTAPASYSGYAWVGIIPSNIKHGSEDENDKNDLDYEYLEGKTQGEVVLQAPEKPGDYDVRMSNDDDPTKGKEVNFVSFKVQ